MNTLDKIAAALRVHMLEEIGEKLIDPHPAWVDMPEDEREAFRAEVRLVLRMAADEIDDTAADELYSGAAAASYLREIADDDGHSILEDRTPEKPSRARAAKSVKVQA